MSLLKIIGSTRPINIDYAKFKQGSKNAALPIIGASLLFDNDLIIKNVPDISDVYSILKILNKINVSFNYEKNTFTKFSGDKFKKQSFSKDFFDTRGGFYLVAALINKWKKIKIKNYTVAGCRIGARGYDNIFRVLAEFGFVVNVIDDNLIINKTHKYSGGRIVLNDLGICVSCVALILAAQFEHKTVLANIGQAPEINDLINFLVANGVNIVRNKNNQLEVWKGSVKTRLKSFGIQDDRIVIATYAVLALISQGSFKIKSIKLQHLSSFIELLKSTGCHIKENKKNNTTIILRGRNMRPVQVLVDDYPRISTDIQPLLATFLGTIKGSSIIKDNIFPLRNFHVEQLQKMNQSIAFKDGEIIIMGGNKFAGNQLCGHDIRCNAALIAAACVAHGVTLITDWEYVNRGYEHLLNIVKQNRELIIK